MDRHDPATGRRAEVERLLQVLAVLRSGDGGWVPRAQLVERVTDYTAPRSTEALERLVERDLETLRQMGFALESDTAGGSAARDRLGSSTWQLPLDLSQAERTLLAWVSTAAAAGEVPSVLTDPDLPSRRTLAAVADLLGTPPRSVDLVHWALAGSRALVIVDDGEEKVVHPLQLVARGSKWFLLLRFPGRHTCYGYRLEYLHIERLGDRIEPSTPVEDVDAVLSPLAWTKDEPVDVEVACPQAHLARVRRDFPGFAVHGEDGVAVLTGRTTNVEALVDRVLGQAGRAWVRSPRSVAAQVVEAARRVAEAS